MRNDDSFDWNHLKRAVRIPLLVTAGALALFYGSVALLPRFVHALAARSLYNYRDLVEKTVAQGDYDGAVAFIERAARDIPRDIYFERPEFMYERIGRLRKEQGGHAAESLDAFLRAQACYFRNIDLQGYLPAPRLVRAIIEGYFDLDNPAGAYHEARAALDMYPLIREQFLKGHLLHVGEDPRIMRDLGLLEIKQGVAASGYERLRQSLVRDPRLPESHYWLGRAAEDLRAWDAAWNEYEAELANCPYAESAFGRMIEVARQSGRDTSATVGRREEARGRAVASFVQTNGTTEPLAMLWGIRSESEPPQMERQFDIKEPGAYLFSIVAHSTPCHGIHGWFEFALNGRHVQTVYADSGKPFGYSIRLSNLEVGRHTFRIENLTDSASGAEDRNVFIHSVRIFRLP